MHVVPLPAAVQRVQLDLLLQKIGIVRLLSPIPFALPLALVFYARWRSPWALVWLALFVAVSTGAYLYRRQLERRMPIADAELGQALRGCRRGIFLLGAMWGLAPWMLDAHGDFAYLLLTSTFVVASIALGSMLAASHQQTIAAGAGLVAAWAWFGGVMGWTLAACTALFVLAALDWIRQQAAQMEQSLRVRFEKEHLAQRLAQQVQLVENANREKTRFFASASHDLRQPLHAISLFTSALERMRLDPAGAETVARLAHSVQALSHSLDTMLDVSRLDAGAVQPRLSAVRVHALFLSLQNTFGMRAQEKGLHLRLRAPGDLMVLSDPLLLGRLLGNLVDNAIKYTHAGGVLVAARRSPPTGPIARVRFEVIDTGLGIPQEHQQHVFEEFYQVGNPQRARRAGLGIGLSIVKRLSALLAHPVEMRSRPQRGTRFRVWVPPAGAGEFAGAEPVPPAQGDASTPGLLRQVLVLDDDEDSLHATAALLALHGCAVFTATHAQEADDLLLREAIDAVVADFRLPGERTGLDVLLALRNAAPHLRAVLITGETAPDRVAAIVASGIPFLHKPVGANQLLHALGLDRAGLGKAASPPHRELEARDTPISSRPPAA